MSNTILWAAILVISVVVELTTTALVSIWFVPASAVCILLEFLKVPLIFQVIAFILISAILAFVLRNKIKASFGKNATATNTDALIGLRCTVEEDIPAGGVGRVRVGGNSWSAYTESGRDILKGESVVIESISGVKLLVRPLCELDISTELVGKTARVESAIDNIANVGTVLCEGVCYPAGMLTGSSAESGTEVRISAVTKDKVLCELCEK